MSKKNKVVNVEVVARENEGGEQLIRRFTKAMKKKEILQEYRDKQVYEKPSDKRHKKKLRRKRIMQKLREEAAKEK